MRTEETVLSIVIAGNPKYDKAKLMQYLAYIRVSYLEREKIEQNRIEQNRTEQNRTEQKRIKDNIVLYL